MSLAVVATCNLNQWAMDFDGNLQRIVESIKQARKRHSRYRIGPELEVSGYGCEDHFLELDTFIHSWEVIASIIKNGHSDDMLLDIGAPIMHRDVAYNCRVLILNRQILLIRPKAILADNGNYREPRWFRSWPMDRPSEQYHLPISVQSVCHNDDGTCLIGHAIIQTNDNILIACETCEELWTPNAPHINLSLAGAHIIGNGSASHHVLRKLHARLDLIQNATRKTGGVYIYSNQRGCDGGRLYFDGCSLISLNGHILTIAPQFSIAPDVDVVTATVDIQDVITYRMKHTARAVQAASYQADANIPYIRPKNKFFLCVSDNKFILPTQPMSKIPLFKPQQEIALGPACWLWDYLRRSGLNGFFIALSGGADSAATTAIVASMCDLIVDVLNNNEEQHVVNNQNELDVEQKRRQRAFNAYNNDNLDTLSTTATTIATTKDNDDENFEREKKHKRYLQVFEDIKRITGTSDETVLKDRKKLANLIVHTAYMSCEKSSSDSTRDRAKSVALDIGTWHIYIDITDLFFCFLKTFETALKRIGMNTENKTPKFKTNGGSRLENLALQNLQARTRMVMTYLFAQLSLWVRGRGTTGGLLVLGSSNVDECLRGYLTKYDCSAADLNPIGGISKHDLKSFLKWAANNEQGLGLTSLMEVVNAKPTAELEPIENGYVQTDEEDMGMSYDDLSWYGRLRKLSHCGPVSMFHKLCTVWRNQLDIGNIATKVKFFFRMYSINRHKVTTLTPSYHAEDYSPEDNRFDLRQFLYNTTWKWQFDKIDAEVKQKSG